MAVLEGETVVRVVRKMRVEREVDVGVEVEYVVADGEGVVVFGGNKKVMRYGWEGELREMMEVEWGKEIIGA